MNEKYVYEQVVLKCDERTVTGRVYPRDIVEKALKEFQGPVKERKVFGPIGPADTTMHLRDAAFVVAKVELEGKEVKATIETLSGLEAGVQLERNLKLGHVELTPVAMGSVSEGGRVGSDLKFIGFSVRPKAGA
jgi:hypothetical protein